MKRPAFTSEHRAYMTPSGRSPRYTPVYCSQCLATTPEGCRCLSGEDDRQDARSRPQGDTARNPSD